LEIENKELLIMTKINGQETIKMLEKQIMELVLENSKSMDRLLKENFELNEIIDALRHEKNELQQQQFKVKSMEKMKTSEENVLQKMFSLVVSDNSLKDRKSHINLRKSFDESNSSLDQLCRRLERTWKNQFQIKNERILTVVRTQAQKDTIFDETLNQLMIDLIVRLDDLQIRYFPGMMFALNECSQITDEGIKALGANICDNFRNLHNLILNLTSTQITDVGLSSLASMLSNSLEHLQCLELGLNSTFITDEALINLGQNICKNLQNLQQLHLYFARCGNILNKGVTNLASQIGKNLKNLQVLKLVFSHTQISDNGAINLGLSICNNLKSLQFLHLYFNMTAISDESLAIIAPLIANLKNLQHLELSFNGCLKITDDGISRLGMAFHDKLKSLKNLYLYLSPTQISDVGIKNLGNSIANHLQSLEGLELGLSGCSKISNECLSSLGGSICTSLRNLKKLFFYFSDTQVSDNGVKSLSGTINQNLKLLRHLRLYFNGSLVTEEAKLRLRHDLSSIQILEIS